MTDFLDDLARTLARPMPRRGAIRFIGGALVAAAVPAALRPGSASAHAGAPKLCEPKQCKPPLPFLCDCRGAKPGNCNSECGVAGSTCCCFKDADGTLTGVIACPPDTRCGRPGESACVFECKKPCGGDCCKPDEFCANPNNRLCCKRGERGCGLKCCKQNEECKTIRVGTASQKFCERRCAPGRAWCGRDKCCPRRWRCANERTGLCKRCQLNEEECGTKCCDRRTSRCCGEAGCCPDSRSCCVNGTGPGGSQVCCPPRTKCATPILRGNIGIVPRTPAICCPDERLNTQPKLCCPPGMVALNAAGFRIPPPGVPPDCCPPGQVCGSGTGRFCANLNSEQANCGRCGNVCPSGTICKEGVCAPP